jgi:drug/metabolite transporter (DMT)-like permease
MRQSDRAGLLFALAGFSLLMVGDALVKGMRGMWSPAAMAATRYVLGAIGLSAILIARQGIGALRMQRPALHWVRGLGVSLGSFGMFAAVWIMPLSEATTISFTQPMITALMAAAFLGERLRLSTILATLAAFGGVIIVLRPDFAVLGLGALLPLLCAAGMAMLVIANRTVAGSASVLVMQVWLAMTASAILVLGTIAGHFSGIEALRMHWPHWSVLARCAIIAVTASFAHYLIYMGTTRAGASTVAPMTYGQLLAAVILGWIFFGDKPDALTLLGAGIIIGAGLYLWHAGRVKEPEEAAP